MIYFKRIFFFISCIFFPFFLLNFWNTYCFINPNSFKVDNTIIQFSNKIFNDHKNQLINIQNDMISTDINLLGSHIEYTNLLTYKSHVDSFSPFFLFQNKKKFICCILEGFLKKDNTGFFSKKKQLIYKIKPILYKLKSEKKTIIHNIRVWIERLKKYFLKHCIPNFVKRYIIYFYYFNERFTPCCSLENGIKSNSFYQVSSHFGVRSKVDNTLSYIAQYLGLTADCSLLDIIVFPLFKLLVFFYSIFHNWGITIIVTTCLIRIMIYPVTRLQYISMLKMKYLNVKINKIKKKYHDDSKKQNEKILSLYKLNKINFLSNFFPFIIQTPIFFAFYYVLRSSIELQCSSFFLWIHDLSSYDPYYILPFLMGFSILLTQLDNFDYKNLMQQKNFFYFIPVLSSVFFLWFPSGLILHYITNNFITFFQQWFIRMNFIDENL
ncbi:Membrane protein insertase YidC [Buchnera aphidicola (Cinara piceae)]|uniref:Membrane protein insertase YidC n=1 Tax=Buchnera aphidicola (Cinara piceae) TaxID=1660043 RepID=A0A803FT63_9GAMM|nr:membrane protein insertase YidC [Buchnera aphidicola]VFP87760.1 Membrane protein insertase YidC [Buchnera aphidicola (Cinara piceae)]